MEKGLLVVILSVFIFFPLFAQQQDGLKIGDTTWTFNGEIRFVYTDQTDLDIWQWSFLTNEQDDYNRMYQRYRFGVTGSLSDRLSAHFEFQVGDEQWGNKNYNEREMNLRTLYAYLQFRPEFLGDNTSFRVGLQGFDDMFKTAIFHGEAVGIIASHETEVLSIDTGFLSIMDDDGYGEIDPASLNVLPRSETLYLAEVTMNASKSLDLKAGLYLDHMKDALTPFDIHLKYHMFYGGLGVDYTMNDNVQFGTQFLYRNGDMEVDFLDMMHMTFDIDGWFAYGYADYTRDDFKARINFGYSPNEFDSVGEAYTQLFWSGAVPDVYVGPGMISINFDGRQRPTAYGLEFAGYGDVCDDQAVYSYYSGMMVVSANLAYKFLYTNFGIIRSTDPTIESKGLGTELDLGVKTNVLKGLEFKAVYAIFFAGEFYGEDPMNAHEMSMRLQYTY